jgi:antitoxin component YwqK of YwqJK toxin-antitoxin module
MFEHNYNNWALNGISKEYNNEGNLQYEEEYNDGKLIKRIRYKQK